MLVLLYRLRELVEWSSADSPSSMHDAEVVLTRRVYPGRRESALENMIPARTTCSGPQRGSGLAS
jgi:hypothetical protein